jgi:hypothetical protein
MRAVWISNRRVMLVYDERQELFVTDFTKMVAGCRFQAFLMTACDRAFLGGTLNFCQCKPLSVL